MKLFEKYNSLKESNTTDTLRLLNIKSTTDFGKEYKSIIDKITKKWKNGKYVGYFFEDGFINIIGTTGILTVLIKNKNNYVAVRERAIHH